MRLFWEEYELDYDRLTSELDTTMREMPAFMEFFRTMSATQLDELRKHSRALTQRALKDGEWGPYLDNARVRGATYARMGIEFAAWFELVSAFQRSLMPAVVARNVDNPARLAEIVVGSTRFIDVAMSVIGSEYLRTKDELNRRQQQAILELSTPVLQVRDRMLILPIIGVVDSNRARQLTEQLLNAIRANRARVVVMDITGVPAVDSKVANHLVQTVEAARLIGARVVVTGLSADVAQALVTLGLDLSKLNTVGDLQGGIEQAELALGYRVVRVEREA